jgi:hypothetical protein
VLLNNFSILTTNVAFNKNLNALSVNFLLQIVTVQYGFERNRNSNAGAACITKDRQLNIGKTLDLSVVCHSTKNQ